VSNNNTTGVTSEAGTVNPSEHLCSPPVFSSVCVARSLVFFVIFFVSLFVLFPLAIVSSVLLRFTASDYPFGIKKNLCCWRFKYG